MKTTSLKLTDIHCDSGTQSRAAINEDTVADYAERLNAGDKFPPVDVFFDGNQYHLGDGFHRILAASRAGLQKFECAIHKGTALDALWFAIGSNGANGTRRTAADKRRAIELALAKFPDKTQEQVAEHVGCSQQYVQQVQSQLTSTCKLTPPKTRKGKDGKSRPTQYKPRKIAVDDPAAPETKPSESPSIPPITPISIESPPADESPKTNDDAWKCAIGISDSKNFFASQLEDIGSACIENGSIDQLKSFKLQLAVWIKKTESAIRTKLQAA